MTGESKRREEMQGCKSKKDKGVEEVYAAAKIRAAGVYPSTR